MQNQIADFGDIGEVPQGRIGASQLESLLHRSMSMPVWEEEQLGNYSHHYPDSMPLPEPTRRSEHNGMYLDVDEGGDFLVGRAANGESSNVLYLLPKNNTFPDLNFKCSDSSWSDDSGLHF